MNHEEIGSTSDHGRNTTIDVSELTTLKLTEYSQPRTTGRCLVAQYSDREVVVYQAYKPALGIFAAEHNHFGNGYSFSRMSWIKPNFTWMVHRCGWATKQDQEVVLALHLRRDFWDHVLSRAVMSNFSAHVTTLGEMESSNSSSDWSGREKNRWEAMRAASDIVLQWDPDHAPFTGHKMQRRVIQLGLRRDTLAAFRGPAFGEGGIEDVTAFVRATAQKHGGTRRDSLDGMLVPLETPYRVEDPDLARRLGIASS